jgi:hypothetical protein
MRIGAGLLVAVLLAAGVAGIATHAYHLGVAQGALAAAAAPGGGPVPPYAYGPYFYHGPFGFAGFLFPFVLVVLALAVLGRAIGGRRRWAGSCGPGGTRVPPMFAEWHRRAHEASEKTGTA